MASVFGPGDRTTENATSQHVYMDGRKPLEIIIIGGSCSGLFVGTLLKRKGHNVRILEVADSSKRFGLAAGIGLSASVKRFFDENDRLKDVPMDTPNTYLEILDSDMNVKSKFPAHMNMTTWDAAYYRLRANFDSYKSSYCPQPPPLEPDEGSGIYETGKRAIRVEDIAGKLKVLTEDVVTHNHETYKADVVIAADGANSTIRKQLQPNVKREEPGYLIWRGTIPLRNLSKRILDRLEGDATVYPMQYSYVLVYKIPGANGSLKDSDREVNFVWYDWASPSARSGIMTDVSGHEHHITVPKGKMRPEVWQKQLERARKMFHPDMFELIEKICEPFVSVVASHISKRGAFFDNRLFLIGDALALKQPNTGQGTNFAAREAMSLVDVIDGKISPEEWEERALEDADNERMRSMTFPSWYLHSWPGYIFIQARARWLVYSQRWCKWWYGSAYPAVRAKM